MQKTLNELNLQEALELLKTKKATSVEITKACLNQIEKLDSKLNAFVTVCNEHALAQATEADKLIAELGEKAFEQKPLLGVPYACKDNFCTEGIETTASSNILKGFIPPYESTPSRKLKEAGAVLLGKTNMDAFAHGSSTETSDFFTTKNPWDVTRVPGGSSGGSSAAVASDMCIFATGSETAGSIRGPASWAGITGLKPSYGRVSRYGIIAMAASTDSPGPMTKTVWDSAYLLKIMAGKDPYDATSMSKPVEDYVSELSKLQNLRGIKIGKPASYFDIELEPEVRERVEESIKILQDMGAEIVPMELLSPKYSIAVYTILQRSEVSSNLSRFDGIRYGQGRENFGFEAKKRIMLGTYSLSSGYYDDYYAKAQKVRTLILDDFEKAFEQVDVIVGPTMPCVATKIGEADKSSMFGELIDELAEPSSIAGLPGISVPCGLSEGVPVGIQVMSKIGNESIILKVANKFQEMTKFHLERPTLV
jgi:aspartyl-tRNA(Asn)/glutamyl-tRNA(Gln) amidotransferase subunit A